MNVSISELSAKQFRAAAQIKERIDTLQGQLNAILSFSGSVSAPPRAVTPGRRKMSAAGRARIAAGARARWAKIKGTQNATSAPSKGRRKMSPEAKARIAAAARLRWKKAKAAGRNSL